MDLTGIYRAFHPKEVKYTFFSNAHGTFSNRPHNRTQNKPQQVQENWTHIKYFLQPQGTETRNQPPGKNSETLKLMDIKYYAIKQWMGQEWDQGRNQKLSGNKLKWTPSSLKLMDTAKAVLRGKFIAIQAYLKKIETFPINNLTLHLQEFEEQQQK